MYGIEVRAQGRAFATTWCEGSIHQVINTMLRSYRLCWFTAKIWDGMPNVGRSLGTISQRGSGKIVIGKEIARIMANEAARFTRDKALEASKRAQEEKQAADDKKLIETISAGCGHPHRPSTAEIESLAPPRLSEEGVRTAAKAIAGAGCARVFFGIRGGGLSNTWWLRLIDKHDPSTIGWTADPNGALLFDSFLAAQTFMAKHMVMPGNGCGPVIDQIPTAVKWGIRGPLGCWLQPCDGKDGFRSWISNPERAKLFDSSAAAHKYAVMNVSDAFVIDRIVVPAKPENGSLADAVGEVRTFTASYAVPIGEFKFTIKNDVERRGQCPARYRIRSTMTGARWLADTAKTVKARWWTDFISLAKLFASSEDAEKFITESGITRVCVERVPVEELLSFSADLLAVDKNPKIPEGWGIHCLGQWMSVRDGIGPFWTYLPDMATVFPSATAAATFRHEHNLGGTTVSPLPIGVMERHHRNQNGEVKTEASANPSVEAMKRMLDNLTPNPRLFEIRVATSKDDRLVKLVRSFDGIESVAEKMVPHVPEERHNLKLTATVWEVSVGDLDKPERRKFIGHLNWDVATQKFSRGYGRWHLAPIAVGSNSANACSSTTGTTNGKPMPQLAHEWMRQYDEILAKLSAAEAENLAMRKRIENSSTREGIAVVRDEAFRRGELRSLERVANWLGSVAPNGPAIMVRIRNLRRAAMAAPAVRKKPAKGRPKRKRAA